MVRSRKVIGLVLVVVYAFFFASTNFFYHSHQLADFKLVHSHPFSNAGHSHTANQIVLIQVIDSAVYEESSAVAAPSDLPLPLVEEKLQWHAVPHVSPSVHSVSLRAPPASC